MPGAERETVSKVDAYLEATGAQTGAHPAGPNTETVALQAVSG